MSLKRSKTLHLRNENYFCLSNFSGRYFLDNFCLDVKNIVNYVQISIYLNTLFPKWDCHFDQRTFRGVAISLLK